MTREGKLIDKIMRGASDGNISFEEMRSLLRGMGFAERVRGSHHIFTKEDVEEILNLQPKGNCAKPYQVKQVRMLFIRYRLGGEYE
ncbi:MAG: type II toxin-antitoxin system HicA family toxin [Armatimonadota bacterium]